MSRMDPSWVADKESNFKNFVKRKFVETINALMINKERTFTISDLVFFERFYYEQSD